MSLAFDSANPDILYAGTTHLPWKTDDGGANWRSIHEGMLDDSDVFSIHVDSRKGNIVHASACSGIYASDNGGEKWKKAQGIPGTDRRTHVVVEDPDYSHLVFAGTTAGLYKSADAGQTWKKLNSYTIRSVEFHPRDGRAMYLATQDAGLMKSMTAGFSFQEINRGFVGRPILRVLFPGPKSIAAVAMRTNGSAGLFQSTDNGASWKLAEPGVSSVRDAVLFKGGVYLRTAGGIARMGKTEAAEESRLPGGAEVTALEAGQAHLWAASRASLFRSTDGVRWTAVQLQSKSAVREIFPGEKSILVSTADGVFLSKTNGARWERGTPPPEQIFQYAVDPADDRAIWAGTVGGLYRSGDAGKTWLKIENGLPPGFVFAVSANPQRPGEWVASQLGDVYRSIDGGASWQRLPGDGIASALVRRLYVQQEQIFALTEGQGIFRRKTLP
jgi:photosystem II stability/assembly factor-like uncharacterized protein